MNNPNKHFHGFAIYYRVYPIILHNKGIQPVKFELPVGQYTIELTKNVWFWQTWIQYAQWIQDVEIKT